MAFVNLPVELRNLTIPGSSLTIPPPTGARRTARRLSAEDSAALAQTGGRFSAGGRQFRVRPIGKMRTNAKVAIPMSRAQLKGLVDSNWVGTTPVVVGEGQRLVRFGGGQ